MTVVIWTAFIVAILALVALDLGVFHRRPHEISVSEALAWSALWILAALAFTVLVHWLYENNWMGAGLAFSVDIDGRTASVEFLTGYLLEKTLSLDNIFVIALIFSSFGVPLAYQHRVLFWGVLGALALRGFMIAIGATLLRSFGWMTYVFGGLLLTSAARLLMVRDDRLATEEHIVVRATRRWIPITRDFHGTRFLVRVNGARVATPLLLVLVMVETSDVVFAVDSIPAIFAVTDQPFIVYTSNVFAVLGLRSLYFALAPLLDRLRYLKTSLVFLLAYVGLKMLIAHHVPIPATVSLAIVCAILAGGVGTSLVRRPRGTPSSPRAPGAERYARRRRKWKAAAVLVGAATLAIGAVVALL